MKKFLFLSTLFLGLVFSACNKDDDAQHHDEESYDVTVSIQNPTDGAEVTMGEAMPVKVEFTHVDGKTIHMVKIEVLDSDGNSVIVLDEGHKHEESGFYVYEAADWTPTMHGTYILRATTSNHAGEKTKSAEVTFTVVHESTGEDYPVDVVIVSPQSGSVNTINEPVHVHVEMTHADAGTIHNVLIEVKNAENEVVYTLVDDHVHEEDGVYEFHSMAFVPSATGTYKLHAMTTSHESDQEPHAHVEFTVQ